MAYEERTHKKEMERLHGNKTPSEIMADNNRKHHNAHIDRQKLFCNKDEAWKKLTPQEQLNALDTRLGKGIGAKKQRNKILAKLEKENDE